MVKHIVMWKIKDNHNGLNKEEICIKIKNELEALKAIIADILKIEVGVNILESPAAYDLVLYSEFTSQEALTAYQNHEAHRNVASYIGQVSEARIVVDYK
ncbi:Dabb family protein [Alloiococcus sp. CFN-8]|uniref:Dabb family protein n=1 Tax=Alloiococcus sp. CFN-8 TaxID=3416081 RepID=UPI003CE67313